MRLFKKGFSSWNFCTLSEGGRVKYKIRFENKSRRLVSGHHMAFEWTPRLNQLKVGTRVVIECKDTTPQYATGIIAELPSWKNRMRFVPKTESLKDEYFHMLFPRSVTTPYVLLIFRFLVFLDDHTPHYVALPLLHLVCKPCK